MIIRQIEDMQILKSGIINLINHDK